MPEPAGAADSIVDDAMRDLVQRTGSGELTVGAALGATAALRDAAVGQDHGAEPSAPGITP